MNAIVYITTNKVNGKKYIGSHAGGDPNYLGSGTRFKKAIRKYGRDNFIRQTLWEGPEEYMREMEEYYIDYYGAHISKLFYNMTKKGTGAIAGKLKPKGFGDKISEANKGKPKPEGFGANYSKTMKGKKQLNISKAKKGKKQPNISKAKKGRKRDITWGDKISEALTGKKHSAETIAKISASKTGKKFSEEHIAKIIASKTGMKYNKNKTINP